MAGRSYQLLVTGRIFQIEMVKVSRLVMPGPCQMSNGSKYQIGQTLVMSGLEWWSTRQPSPPTNYESRVICLIFSCGFDY
jgi:hypothetical protein